MNRGYLALWRKFQDHPFWKEHRVFSKAEAWIDILWEVQHEPEPQRVVIGMRVFECGYAESLKSHRTWGRRWGWEEPKVRRFLKLLCELSQIEQKSEGVTTRIKVLNYEQYDPKRRANDATLTQQRRSNDAATTTDKHYKHEKNEKNKETPLPPKQLSKPKFQIPGWVLADLWFEFVEMRRLKKKPLTEGAKKRRCEELKRLVDLGHDQATVLKNTIDGGWDKFYAPNGNGHRPQPSSPVFVTNPVNPDDLYANDEPFVTAKPGG